MLAAIIALRSGIVTLLALLAALAGITGGTFALAADETLVL